MEAKYFNSWEFLQALSLTETNPFEAKNRFEQYLTKYPNDYSAYPYYISILITLSEDEEAEKVLNYINKIYKNDYKFIFESNKVKILERNIVVSYLKLFSYRCEYDKVCQLLLNNKNELFDININALDFFCKCKTDKLKFNTRKGNSYLFRQIIDYKESDFLNHIKKHLYDYNKNIDNPNSSIFTYNFPLDIVIEEIKKNLLSGKMLFNGFYQDTYVFKYPNCGVVNNKFVDFFEVVCFHNTKDFITMYPILGGINLPYIDLDYLVKKRDDDNNKVKRLSQIEIFNKRYKHF